MKVLGPYQRAPWRATHPDTVVYVGDTRPADSAKGKE
jgi:hypothetical protein